MPHCSQHLPDTDCIRIFKTRQVLIAIKDVSKFIWAGLEPGSRDTRVEAVAAASRPQGAPYSREEITPSRAKLSLARNVTSTEKWSCSFTILFYTPPTLSFIF